MSLGPWRWQIRFFREIVDKQEEDFPKNPVQFRLDNDKPLHLWRKKMSRSRTDLTHR